MKKRKEYDGLIPFDVWGNQLHYSSGYNGGHEITQDNLQNGFVCLEEGYNTKKYKPLFFQDRNDLKLVLHPKPVHTRYDYNKTGPETVIGTITSVIEIKNHIFTDNLSYSHHTRGRSAAYFIFKRADGRHVSMFLKDFEEAVRNMEKGELKGSFTFCKRGSNYGCRFLG